MNDVVRAVPGVRVTGQIISSLLWGLLLMMPLVQAGNVTYTYDEAGRLKVVTYSAGTTVTYTLNAPCSRSSVPTTAVNDTTVPSVPTGLAGTAPNAAQVNLSWTASSDTGGSGLAGYTIYRGTTPIGTSTTSSFSDSVVQMSATELTASDRSNSDGVRTQPASVSLPLQLTAASCVVGEAGPWS